MQPETAIDNWQQWPIDLKTRPRILKPLSAGQSNQSFLLISDSTKLVLRLNQSERFLPGENRDHETAIWQLSSEQGISPTLDYVDKDRRFFISRYIDNELPSEPPFNDSYVNQALDLLEKCHQLDIKPPQIDYQEHIQNYWQQLESKNPALNSDLQNQRPLIQAALNQLITSQTPTGLCHHDPIPANFIGTPERLYLIDWEYATTSLIIMDYAALAIEWNLEDKTILNRTTFDPTLFNQAKTLYTALCTLWQALNALSFR